MISVEEEGWAWPSNSRRWHYFVGSLSLCNKWMFTGPLQGDFSGVDRSDDCLVCSKRLVKRQEAYTK